MKPTLQPYLDCHQRAGVDGQWCASRVPGPGGLVKWHGGNGPAFGNHVGVDVLKPGGNAVDAAVAVGYALAGVYPAAGQPRRWRFHDRAAWLTGARTFLDFREKSRWQPPPICT